MRFARNGALALILLAILATAGLPAGAAAQGDNDYAPYAILRDKMVACSLDHQWQQLGSAARRRCRSMRKLYEVWRTPDDHGGYHLHCLTSKCPATPTGEPDARSPIPDGADVYR
jgi:hypothetical protein